MSSFSDKNYLKEVIEILQTEFPDDWINPRPFKNQEDFSIWISGKFFVYNKICEKIDYSIISGEYIIKKKNILSEEFLEIKTVLKNIVVFTLNPIPGCTIDLSAKYFLQIETYFVKPLISLINRYAFFLESVERSINAQNSNSILFEKNDDDAFSDKENELTLGIADRFKLVNYNLELAKIDIYLKVDEYLLSRCLQISEEVEEFITKVDYSKIIIQKANYLAYKILYRFEQDEKTYLYSLDFSVQETNKDQLEIGIFNEFKDLTDHHYDDQKSKSTVFSKKRIETFYSKISDGESLDLLDYHAAIKQYKDNRANIERLNNLVGECEQFCSKLLKKNGISIFDKKAIEITKQYIRNNLASLQIEKKVIGASNFKDFISEVSQNNESTRIYNYFPFYKIAILLKQNIENNFNSENPDIQIIENLLFDFENVVRELMRAYNWCEKNSFIAFQLPFNECVINVKESNLSVFLSSSFVLPINYQKLLNEVKIIESQILKFDTMFNIQKSISKQKNQIDQVRQETQKSERRSIEILSVFAAIVLFVSGNIQAFTKIETIDRAMQFMLVFAYVMGLFVFLIWFISRPEGVKRISLISVHGLLFLIFSLATITAILIVTGLPPFEKLNQSDQYKFINKRIDSTKLNVDSIVLKNGLRR